MLEPALSHPRLGSHAQRPRGSRLCLERLTRFSIAIHTIAINNAAHVDRFVQRDYPGVPAVP